MWAGSLRLSSHGTRRNLGARKALDTLLEGSYSEFWEDRVEELQKSLEGTC